MHVAICHLKFGPQFTHKEHCQFKDRSYHAISGIGLRHNPFRDKEEKWAKNGISREEERDAITIRKLGLRIAIEVASMLHNFCIVMW